MMTVLTTLRRGGVPLDLGKATVFLAGTLAYLAVPWHHAVLAAVSLILQACVGTYLLDRLLNKSAWSFLLLLGPGIIVGGAFCFAVFQLTGRGDVGLISSTLVGLCGATALLRRHRGITSQSKQAATWLHLAGMSLFAMSSEFEWLLAAGASFFFAGIATHCLRSRCAGLRIAVNLALGTGLMLALQLRHEWWWVITDDYSFFDVLARHVTLAGPFEPWGATSFSNYHWLSYGWSGLLSKAIGTPTTLMTLSQIMPLVYSLALAATLLHIAQLLHHSSDVPPRAALSVAAVLASTRLDWSGTSTAGAYAVIGTLVVTAMLILESQTTLMRRSLIYLLIAIILALTKLPSVLVLPCTALLIEARIRWSNSLRPRLRMIWTAAVFGCGLALAGSWMMSRATSSYTFAFPNPGLGELATRGMTLAVVALSLRWAWLIIIFVMICVLGSRGTRSPRTEPELLLLGLVPMFLLGITFDLLVSGNANAHEYFSGPAYFLSALCVMTLSGSTPVRISRSHVGEVTFWVAIAISLFVWNWLVSSSSLAKLIDYDILRQAIGDYRILYGLVLTGLIITRTRNRSEIGPQLLLLLTLVSFPAISVASSQIAKELREPSPTRNDVGRILGSPDSELTGQWLRGNTPHDALIATNSLFQESSDTLFGSDYSLAMWSQREFLVLGPRFASAAETAPDEIDLCIRFGKRPSSPDFESLRKLGVTWFIVDTSVSSQQSFTNFGEIVFVAGQFQVVRLFETELS